MVNERICPECHRPLLFEIRDGRPCFYCKKGHYDSYDFTLITDSENKIQNPSTPIEVIIDKKMPALKEIAEKRITEPQPQKSSSKSGIFAVAKEIVKELNAVRSEYATRRDVHLIQNQGQEEKYIDYYFYVLPNILSNVEILEKVKFYKKELERFCNEYALKLKEILEKLIPQKICEQKITLEFCYNCGEKLKYRIYDIHN